MRTFQMVVLATETTVAEKQSGQAKIYNVANTQRHCLSTATEVI